MTVRLADRRIELIEVPRTRCRCRQCGRIWRPALRSAEGWWVCPSRCNAG